MVLLSSKSVVKVLCFNTTLRRVACYPTAMLPVSYLFPVSSQFTVARCTSLPSYLFDPTSMLLVSLHFPIAYFTYFPLSVLPHFHVSSFNPNFPLSVSPQFHVVRFTPLSSCLFHPLHCCRVTPTSPLTVLPHFHVACFTPVP